VLELSETWLSVDKWYSDRCPRVFASFILKVAIIHGVYNWKCSTYTTRMIFIDFEDQRSGSQCLLICKNAALSKM